MANDKPTELARYITKGEVLFRPGDLRITIDLDREDLIRAEAALATIRERLRGVACRRIVLPSDEGATIIDQD